MVETTPINVLFADDKSAIESSHIEKAFRQALLKMAPHRDTEWHSYDDREEALEHLRDDAAIDIALIDAFWGSIFSGQENNHAHDLLRAARDRSDCVTILVSRDGQVLLDALYADDYKDFRPHSVLLKDQIASQRTLIGVVDSAFGTAMRPIRSSHLSFHWTRDENLEFPTFHDAATVAFEELSSQAVPGATTFDLSPIGGGMSDSLTCLVEVTESNPSRGIVPKRLLIKATQDPRVLEIEEVNHRKLVETFPAATYARLASSAKARFGGWHSLVFEQVQGQTLSWLIRSHKKPQLDRLLSLFTHDYVESAVATCSINTFVPRQWVESPQGLLRASRRQRLERSLTDLAAIEPLLLDVEVSGTFSDVRSLGCFGIVHGDLHARNVMVRRDDSVFLVDAASMRPAGLWAEDPTRLLVWSLCESLDGPAAEAIDASVLVSTLLGDDPQAPKELQQAAAVARELQDRYANAFADRKLGADVARDWSLALRCELLRVAYSGSSFQARIRAVAATSALLVHWEPS